MNNQLTVPATIAIGQVKRSDTYTGRLGYVIYKDEKGVLRKKTSWEGWRDKTIEPIYTDNVPTEGFVLNRNGGGDSHSRYSDYYSRAAFIRVYDPRDFEFEISVANLLFILRYADCSRGKGLEGKFVYAWDGKDLVLLPEGCQEYKDSIEFTSLKTMKVSTKELVKGGTYYTKDQRTVVYMGKFNWKQSTWSRTSSRYIDEYLSEHVFYSGSHQSYEDYLVQEMGYDDAYWVDLKQRYETNYNDYMERYNANPTSNNKYWKETAERYTPEGYEKEKERLLQNARHSYNDNKFFTLKTAKLAKVLDTNPVADYAFILSDLERTGRVLMPGSITIERKTINVTKPKDAHLYYWNDGKILDTAYLKVDETTYKQVEIVCDVKESKPSWYTSNPEENRLLGFRLRDICEITYDGVNLKRKDLKKSVGGLSILPENLNSLDFYELTTMVDNNKVSIN
jgi:hypothetical protein